MKKLVSLLICLILTASALCIPAAALGETMNASVGTPVIDGVIDDVWKTTERQQLSHLKAGDLKGDGTLPEECSCYASVLWDKTALYFLFEITDDDFSFEGDVGHWQNDSIYLYIDENDLFGSTWNEGQAQIALLPAEDMSLFPRNGTPCPDGYQLAYSYPTENTCVIEFKYVPATFPLETGKELLCDFQYNDGTEFNTRDYCFGWSDESDGASGNSSLWGYVTLTGDPTTVAAPAEAEAPAAETTVETEAATEAAVETAPVATAPQTSDAVTVFTFVVVLAAMCAFICTRKKIIN